MFNFKNQDDEFSRKDPAAYRRIFWLTALNWIVPIIIILIGIFITTQKFAPLMNYDERVIGRPLLVIKGYKIYNPLIFLLSIFKYAFDDVYSYYFFQAIPPVFISLAIAIILFMLTSLIVASHQKNQHIHGTARWATKKDLEKSGILQKYGVVCGELDNAKVTYHVDKEKATLVLDLPKTGLTQSPKIAPFVCHSGRTNTMMVAPTRSGKGVSSIIPTCLNYGIPYWVKDKGKRVIKGRGSIVVFDAKGENWEATAGYRSKFSVCIPFRPMDPDYDTARYNPLHEIPDNPSEAFAWADIISEIFFGAENSKSSSDGASEYFKNMARDIFTGVVLHVRFSSLIPWENKNLGTVLDIFSQNQANENSVKQPQDEEDSECGSALFMAMKEDGIHVHDDGTENPEIHNIIVLAANRSETQPGRERASTFSTVFSKISLFQDPLVRYATSYSDFSIDDFINGKDAISLYLIVPYNHIKRISPVFRMLITFMIKKFSSGTTNANAVKLKIPCLFILDEFPVLGYFPDIAQNAGILAGYGVTFFIICQSLNQIIDTYGENHPFLDHCKTIILFAPGNLKDAKQFSESFGNRSVLLDNISSSGNRYNVGFSNISRSSQETSVSLINPDELMKLDFSRAIVMVQNQPPYKAKKVVYYADPRLKNKAFLRTPNLNSVKKMLRRLPSNIKANKQGKSLVNSIKKIESIEVLKVIPNDFNLFVS